jgi:hypothetical protein
MFVAQALKPDRSCQGIVNDAVVNRLNHGLPQCSTITGGYCKARKRLPLELVSKYTLPGRTFSRSYGANLPSSLKRLRILILPTCVGLRYGLNITEA